MNAFETGADPRHMRGVSDEAIELGVDLRKPIPKLDLGMTAGLLYGSYSIVSLRRLRRLESAKK